MTMVVCNKIATYNNRHCFHPRIRIHYMDLKFSTICETTCSLKLTPFYQIILSCTDCLSQVFIGYMFVPFCVSNVQTISLDVTFSFTDQKFRFHWCSCRDDFIWAGGPGCHLVKSPPDKVFRREAAKHHW